MFTIPFAGAQQIRDERKSEAHGSGDDSMTEMDFGNIRDLPNAMKILFTNPPFLFTVFYAMMDAMLVAGFTSFGPKYVETQFSMEAGYAGMLFGTPVFGDILFKFFCANFTLFRDHYVWQPLVHPKTL